MLAASKRLCAASCSRFPDASPRLRQNGSVVIREHDGVPMRCEDLRHTMPHESGADDCYSFECAHNACLSCCSDLSRCIAAIEIDDVAGHKIGSARSEIEQRANQILRFTEPPNRDAREKVLVEGFIVEHPLGERGADHRWRDGIDVNA